MLLISTSPYAGFLDVILSDNLVFNYPFAVFCHFLGHDLENNVFLTYISPLLHCIMRLSDCFIYYVARLCTCDLHFCRFCYWPHVDSLNYTLLKLCLPLPKGIFCNVMQHNHQKNHLKKKLKFVFFFLQIGNPSCCKKLGG